MTPNKTDAGNGSNGICRVIAASRSPSPDPSRSARNQVLHMSLFTWFTDKSLTPEETRLLREVKEFGHSNPTMPMIVAIEAAYLPHGGRRKVWFYADGDDFDCHSSYQRFGGSISVAKSRVPILQIRTLLADNCFFDLTDRKPDVIDGCPFTIAVLDQSRAHNISANVGFPEESPHGRLFEGLMSVFPTED